MGFRAKPTEEQFQRQVIQLAKLRGWLVHHVRPARTAKGWRTPVMGDVGFPDLVLVRAGVVIFAELKSDTGKPTDAQTKWLDELRDTGAASGIWRPMDWTKIEEALS